MALSDQSNERPTEHPADESAKDDVVGMPADDFPQKTPHSLIKNIPNGALMLLVAAILLPVLFTAVNQQRSLNDIRNRASEPDGIYPASCGGASQPTQGCDGGKWFCNSLGRWGCDMGGAITGACPNPLLVGGGDPCMKNGVHVSCSEVGMIRCYCGGPPKDQPGAVWVAGSAAGGATCNDLCTAVGYNCGTTCQPPHEPPAVTPPPTTLTTTRTPTVPPPTATYTLTPTPTIVPMCVYIKVYKNNIAVDPFTLRPGDNVTLAVNGRGGVTKARFRVNGSTFVETTAGNSVGEYVYSTVVPVAPSFTVDAEVFINGAWY